MQHSYGELKFYMCLDLYHRVYTVLLFYGLSYSKIKPDQSCMIVKLVELCKVCLLHSQRQG